MKRLLIIFILILAVSCKSLEQRAMESHLRSITKVSSFVGFEKYDSISFAGEIKTQLVLNERNLTWNRGFYRDLSEMGDTSAYKYKLAMETNLKNIAYLKSLTPDDRITFVFYKLIYKYLVDGEPVFDVCFGKFNTNGELVAFKPDGKAPYDLLGNNCSIPDYEPQRGFFSNKIYAWYGF